MTVDFPASFPANTVSPSKPIDVWTLQETFAALLRSYGTEKGGSPIDTMLEILRPAPSDKAEGYDQNQQRREHQQYTERNDVTHNDRKLLDKSEIRSGEINSDYRNRLDRCDALQNDYREKIERSEPQPLADRTVVSSSAEFVAPLPDAAKTNEVFPIRNHLPPLASHVPHIAGTDNESSLTGTVAPSRSPGSEQGNVVIPMSMNTPASIPTPSVPQSGSLPTFTVFTPSGRFGHLPKKSDEKENEDEEAVEKNTDKPLPFAVFESVRVETTRPLQRTPSRQLKESVAQSEVRRMPEEPPKKVNKKTKATEPETFRSVKTTADLLEMPAHNVAAQKKGETNQPNPEQYLHRIAAAWEAAAQYAPIRMKINLDHLGTLTLWFFYKADKLALRFETPSKESAQFVRDHLDGLQTILSRRNIQFVDIEIYQEV